MGGRQDGANDLVVAGTTAEVSGECKANLLLRGIGVLLEQRFGCNDKSRRADSALQRSTFQEALLHDIQLPLFGDPFNRLNSGGFGFNRQHQATVHGTAIQHDGTGTAVAVVAAFLGAGHAERVPQYLKQALSRLAEKLRDRKSAV